MGVLFSTPDQAVVVSTNGGHAEGRSFGVGEGVACFSSTGNEEVW